MNASGLKKWFEGINWMAVTLVALILLVLFRALSLPGVGAVREPTRRANCNSNLRQIGIALSIYAEQYQGRLPMDDAAKPTLVGSIRLLSNDLTSVYAWICPSDRRPGTGLLGNFRGSYEDLTTKIVSYSYVPNLMWYGPQNTNPPAIVMLDRIGSSTAAGSKWPKDGNHRNTGGNILFTDGHVQWATRLPSALKDKNGKEIVLSP